MSDAAEIAARYAMAIMVRDRVIEDCVKAMSDLRLEAAGETERAVKVAEMIRAAKQVLADAAPDAPAPVLLTERHTLYAIRRNTDTTEGRGHDITVGVAKMQATALRIARKIDVQGSDGTVRPFKVMRDQHGDDWIPVWAGHDPVAPAVQDMAMQTKLDERAQAIAKAKSLGLSDEDIAALRG